MHFIEFRIALLKVTFLLCYLHYCIWRPHFRYHMCDFKIYFQMCLWKLILDVIFVSWRRAVCVFRNVNLQQKQTCTHFWVSGDYLCWQLHCICTCSCCWTVHVYWYSDLCKYSLCHEKRIICFSTYDDYNLNTLCVLLVSCLSFFFLCFFFFGLPFLSVCLSFLSSRISSASSLPNNWCLPPHPTPPHPTPYLFYFEGT